MPLVAKAFSDSAWTLCGLSQSAGGLISVLDPTNNASLRHQWIEKGTYRNPLFWSTIVLPNTAAEDFEPGTWTAARENSTWRVDVGNAYLVLNFSLGSDEGNGMPPWLDKNIWSLEGRGPWMDGRRSSNQTYDDDGYFQASLCYDALPKDLSYNHVQEFNISSSAETERTEPSIKWMSESETFDTFEVRRQLGALRTRNTADERGIFRLDLEKIQSTVRDLSQKWVPPSPPNDLEAQDIRWYNWFSKMTFAWAVNQILPWRQDGLSAPLCFFCSNRMGQKGFDDPEIKQTLANVVQSAIFNDILKDTDSPALALQAQLTILLRMAYYDWLPTFDAKSDISTLSSQSSLVPVSRKGYWPVICIVWLHVLTLVTISLIFFKTTRFSILDNAWQAVVQVGDSKGVMDVVSGAKAKTDKELRKVLKAVGRGATIYKLRAIEEGGPIALVPTAKEDWT